MRKSANSEDAPQQTPRNTVSLDGMDNHDGDCESNVIIEHRKTWIALIKFGCHMDRKHTKWRDAVQVMCLMWCTQQTIVTLYC